MLYVFRISSAVYCVWLMLCVFNIANTVFILYGYCCVYLVFSIANAVCIVIAVFFVLLMCVVSIVNAVRI